MLFASLFIPFLVALLLVPAVRSLAYQKRWFDTPDHKRKIHTKQTPSVGGLAIAAGFSAGLIVLMFIGGAFAIEYSGSMIITLSCGLLILAAGLYDDTHHLGAKKKFFVQLIVAYMLLHAGFSVEIKNLPFIDPDPYQQALISIPLTMIWIVGIINAINLLDGLDGLAAGVSLIAFAGLACLFFLEGNIPLALVSLLLVGALAAFLCYNFNPASIFMGDTGSLFLGFMLAVLTLSLKDGVHPNAGVALFVPVILLSLPIFDTTLCIVRRLLSKRSPFAPDKDHIHHHLAKLLPHRKAVLVLYGVALWFGASAVLLTQLDLAGSLLIIGVSLVLPCIGLFLVFGATRKMALAAVHTAVLAPVTIPAPEPERGSAVLNDAQEPLVLEEHSPESV